MTDYNQLGTIIQIVVILILGYLIMNKSEGMCVQKSYGVVTDVPASIYADANTALTKTTSLGQAPLGDPQYWIPNRSPITQGQYGLYQTTLPIKQTQPFDRSSLDYAASAVPIYSDEPLPPQCTPLN